MNGSVGIRIEVYETLCLTSWEQHLLQKRCWSTMYIYIYIYSSTRLIAQWTVFMVSGVEGVHGPKHMCFLSPIHLQPGLTSPAETNPGPSLCYPLSKRLTISLMTSKLISLIAFTMEGTGICLKWNHIRFEYKEGIINVNYGIAAL